MALQTQTIQLPFTFGLDEAPDPAVLERGFTLVTNGDYQTPGVISKRPGVASVLTTNTSGVLKLFVFNDERLFFTDGVSLFDAYDLTASALTFLDTAFPIAVTRRYPMHRDLNDTGVSYADVAVANGFKVMCWADGTNAYYQILNAQGQSVSGPTELTSGQRPKVAANPENDYVLLTYGVTGGNIIKGIRVDCSGTSFSVGSAVNLVTDAETSFRYDMAPETSGSGTGWVLAYLTSGSGLKVYMITSVPAQGTLVWSGDSLNFTGGVPAVADIDDDIFIAGRRSTTALDVAVYDKTGAVVASRTNVDSPAGLVGAIGIEKWSTSKALITWTETPASGPNIFHWRTFNTAATLGTQRSVARGVQLTRGFLRGGRFYTWLTSGLDEATTCPCLVQLRDNAACPVPVASMAPGLTPATVRNSLATVTIDSDTVAHAGFCLQTGGTTSPDTGERVEAHLDTLDRYKWVEFGGLLYVCAGVPTIIDGQDIWEQGFAQEPGDPIPSEGTAGGSLTEGDILSYVLVYEYIDRQGNLHQSAPSEAVSFTVTANLRVDVDLNYLTMGLRAPSVATGENEVQLALYRANLSGDGIYYRHYARTSTSNLANNPVATGYATDTDNGFSTANPTLYTTGGVLEFDHVYGGATCICVHKNRLWMAGGEEGDLIWYSSEQTYGEPARFNLAQQLRVPEGRITLLESLDDALIVGTKNHLYMVLGEGPNTTGDAQSGYFTVPLPIPTDGGCSQIRSVVTCPLGILYWGRQGIYLIDRSRKVTYVSDAVKDTIATYSVVRDAIYVQHRGEIRWMVNDGSTNWRVLVFDFEAARWSVWQYAHTGNGGAMGYLNGVYYHTDQTGDLYKEDPASAVYTDASSWYGVKLTTGHIGFGSWMDYKRLRRATLMLNRDGTGGLVTTIARNGEAVGQTAQWTEAEVTALDENMARIDLVQQQGNRWQFTVYETQPASPDQGLGFIGMAFEVASIGGVQRAPAADTK